MISVPNLALESGSRETKNSPVFSPNTAKLSSLEQAENKTTLDLLMKLRVGAILGQCFVIWPALQLGWLLPNFILPYCIVVAALCLLTLCTNIALKRNIVVATPAFFFFQLGIDTLALTLLLKFTGGPWNPFISLILFHAALGALNLRGAWLTYYVIFVVWCLALVHWDPALSPALLDQPTPSEVLFPIQSLVLLLFVGLIIWSNHILEQQRKVLLRVREEKNQVDRLRAFGVIATGFSHEFATPLATLKLKLNRLKNRESLENDPDLEIALEAASQAENSLKIMMSQKFLPENSEFVKIELPAAIQRVIDLVNKDKNTITFTHPNSRIWITAPQVSFNQMILDLIDNAKHANRERNTHEINFSLELNSRFATLDILDSGPGFPTWIIEHVGTPFFSTRSEGAGLGLYHAHVLSQAMGGELCLSNLKGGGAKVTLRLPIAESQIEK